MQAIDHQLCHDFANRFFAKLLFWFVYSGEKVTTCSSTNEWNVRKWFSCSDLCPPWVQVRTVVEGEPSRQFPLLKSRLTAVDPVAGSTMRHRRQRLYCDHSTGQHWLSIIVSLYRYDESRETDPLLFRILGIDRIIADHG